MGTTLYLMTRGFVSYFFRGINEFKRESCTNEKKPLCGRFPQVASILPHFCWLEWGMPIKNFHIVWILCLSHASGVCQNSLVERLKIGSTKSFLLSCNRPCSSLLFVCPSLSVATGGVIYTLAPPQQKSTAHYFPLTTLAKGLQPFIRPVPSSSSLPQTLPLLHFFVNLLPSLLQCDAVRCSVKKSDKVGCGIYTMILGSCYSAKKRNGAFMQWF